MAYGSLSSCCTSRALLRFPTRRSSDLREDEYALRARGAGYQEIAAAGGGILSTVRATQAASVDDLVERIPDRKSTRLNSSHEWISYAVFCVEKKIDHALVAEDDGVTCY